MKADLHIHSVYSDGNLNVKEIALKAKSAGLELFSITDHDAFKANDFAREESEKLGLKYLNGIEFSAYNGSQVHVLGYNFSQGELVEKECQRLQELREKRKIQMIEKLKENCGIEIDYSSVEKNACGSSGSLHIAKAIFKAGHGESIEGVFKKYIGFGAPCYASENRQTPEEAVRVITKAGGVAVLAHPGQIKMEEDKVYNLIKRLISLGLKGIEAYYSTHTKSQTQSFANFAEKNGLIVTCGSDFHGEGRAEILGGVNYKLKKNALKVLGIE